MDFLRARAVPALTVLACLSALAARAEDCGVLDGTYRFKSAGAKSTPSLDLAKLVSGRATRLLYPQEGSRTTHSGLVPPGPIQIGKRPPLAVAGVLKYTDRGARLRFMDAAGKLLVEMGLDSSGSWKCANGRLERSGEHLSGLGDAIHTERVDEWLERDRRGDLVYGESRAVVDARDARPVRHTWRFPAIR